MLRRLCMKYLYRAMVQTKKGAMNFCTSTADDVLFEQIKSTGVISLNRPKALNSLNLSMIRKIHPQLLKWEETGSTVKQVIIVGCGDKAFCAGGDIISVTESAKAGTSLYSDFFAEEYALNHQIATCRLPYVAIIDGITMGGGVGLSIHGSHRVATERTLVAMPETAIGLFADVGSTYPLSRLPGSLGAYLTLTGYRLKGMDVQHAGITTHYVTSSLIPSLIERLSSIDWPDTEAVCEVLDDYQSRSVESVTHDFTLAPYLQKISALFGRDTVEGIREALKSDGSDWSIKQLAILDSMSPTSMKITLRHLMEACTASSLVDVLRKDYRLSIRCAEGEDFREGVRAKLVDKDNKPTWRPVTLREVTEDAVNHYFSPLPAGQEWTAPDTAL